MSVEVVGVKALLPPGDVDLGVDTFLSNLDGVRDVETHVAVDHDGESERGKGENERSASNRARQVEARDDEELTQVQPSLDELAGSRCSSAFQCDLPRERKEEGPWLPRIPFA